MLVAPFSVIRSREGEVDGRFIASVVAERGCERKYGIPASNPFANDNNPDTLGEIYAYGVRNPQRLFWDAKNGNMFMSDIGQNTVEEISPVAAGANLGWND